MKKIQYIIVALFLLQINSAEAQTQTVTVISIFNWDKKRITPLSLY